MGLSSLQLDAFAKLVQCGSFSQAAKALHITQSALSQRIAGLEEELQCSLVIRGSAGIQFTPAGSKLARHCRTREALESELVSELELQRTELSGFIRIAGVSSVVRSVILPTMAPMLRDHPHVKIEAKIAELRDLEALLLRNETDLIVTYEASRRQEITSVELGYETNVLVESKDFEVPKHRYLDHDSEDMTTIEFLRFNNKATDRIERVFLDEIYSIIDGVRLGLGRAVVPRQLLTPYKTLRVVRGLKPLNVGVFLQYVKQPFITKLQQSAIDNLVNHAGRCLASD